MAVPKQRLSRTRQGNRRSHQALGKIDLRPCPKCHKPTLPHRACKHCGFYQ